MNNPGGSDVFLLAMETSVHACSVALYHQGHIYCDEVVAPRQQTQLLLPMIQSLLERCELRMQDLTHLAYSAGPGAFSGVRLSAAAVQGLAVALECPLLAISTLEVLAQGVRRMRNEDQVCVVTDARMNEVYAAAFVWESGIMKRIYEDRLCRIDDLPKLSGSWFLAGNGVGEQPVPFSLHGRDSSAMPSAQDVASLAVARIEAGSITSPEQALPVYLRNDVWKKMPGKNCRDARNE